MPFQVTLLVQLLCLKAVTSQAKYHVDMDKNLQNKALDDEYILLTLQQATGAPGCFAQCLTRCRCLTFQVCNETLCQLLTSSRFLTPEALRAKSGCTYYDMVTSTSHQDQGMPTCDKGINCCRSSHPCLNGGTCTPSTGRENNTRFQCSCLQGFHGNRCEYQVAMASCREFVPVSRQNASGKYQIESNSTDIFEVFCDFQYNTSMVWTLIQSYQLVNIDSLKNPFFTDWPVNQDTPSWDSYRLSLQRMTTIRQDSTQWAITCNYDTEGVVHRDFVVGNLKDVDILTFDGRSCIRVDINIRGESCSNCTVHARQGLQSLGFHIDTGHKYGPKCDFYPEGVITCEDNRTEDNFGHYHCVNPAHRCSATAASTTQTWLGGTFEIPSQP